MPPERPGPAGRSRRSCQAQVKPHRRQPLRAPRAGAVGGCAPGPDRWLCGPTYRPRQRRGAPWPTLASVCASLPAGACAGAVQVQARTISPLLIAMSSPSCRRSRWCWLSPPTSARGFAGVLCLLLPLVCGCTVLAQRTPPHTSQPTPQLTPQPTLGHEVALRASSSAAPVSALTGAGTALRDDVVSPSHGLSQGPSHSPAPAFARSMALLQMNARRSSSPTLANARDGRAPGHAEADLGVRVSAGRSSATDRRAGAATSVAQAGVGFAPALSLARRVRVTDERALFADAYRARGERDGGGPAGPGRASKLGVEWSPAKATFGLEHGAVGMQLESGYRLSVKVRHGRPSLYLRGRF